MDLIQQNAQWFVDANQQPADPTPSPQQVGFYVGMQLEELAEKIDAIDPKIGVILHTLGDEFKQGAHHANVLAAMADPAMCKEMLDADIDLLWVSVGGARAQGADVIGAYGAVNEANWRKRWADGKFHNDPQTSKVLKPEGWQAPDLTPFIHPALRNTAGKFEAPSLIDPATKE